MMRLCQLCRLKKRKTKPPLECDAGLRDRAMLPFVSVLVLSAFALGEPNVAKGEALFQSSVRVYGRKSFSDQRLDLEEASLNLLEAEAADSLDAIDTVMKPKEKETLTGLALLYADLIWIWGLLRGSA
ncbi:unnamed protein product [Cladocopium goreaui]|uniref:Uncharacterized protein n=1 Tax=Cladocopium goreaui TaxID=2562237 RepID=A0A9P1GEG7_9DINO|nr:unnamed protein product [Cladocopium goreaui]